MNRTCIDCGAEHPISDFPKHRRCKDGVLPRCRECKRRKDRERYQQHREQILAAQRDSYAADPEPKKHHAQAYRSANAVRVRERKAAYRAENLDRLRATEQRWHSANRERDRKTRRQWDDENKDRRRALRRRWIADNPAKVVAGKKRWLSRRRNAPVVDFTADEWSATTEYFGHRCAYCLKPSPVLEQEHMKPLSRGGHHTAENIVPACPSCNKRKHTQTPLEMLMRQAFHRELAEYGCWQDDLATAKASFEQARLW